MKRPLKNTVPASKKNGGDLGWMPEGNLQSIMGQEISEDKLGQIIGPVHSQYGYHILKISEIEIEKIEGPFTPELAMDEANRIFPDIHSLLFKQFHIGMPVTPYKPEETISSVCKTHNVPVQAALDAINKEFSEKNIAIMTCEQLKAKLDEGNKPVLLDIRESWERDISKLEGSHIINAENNEHVLSSFEKDREMVLIDWKQDRSPSFPEMVCNADIPMSNVWRVESTYGREKGFIPNLIAMTLMKTTDTDTKISWMNPKIIQIMIMMTTIMILRRAKPIQILCTPKILYWQFKI
ncbi:MAG: hypothetical protein CM1200mP16_14440 [Nitrospina sp.]|nr:MAG: hypothetical protein CM1200mP16_14440 [Nitrospina sp.]